MKTFAVATESICGYYWKHFRNHLRYILQSFVGHTVYICGYYWKHFRIIPQSFAVHTAIICGTYRNYLLVILQLVEVHTVCTLYIFLQVQRVYRDAEQRAEDHDGGQQRPGPQPYIGQAARQVWTLDISDLHMERHCSLMRWLMFNDKKC